MTTGWRSSLDRSASNCCASLGRIGVTVDSIPAVLPVWVVMIDDRLIFRTVPGTKLEMAAAGAVVALEVDDFDAQSREGWSVLVRGLAAQLGDPAVIEQAKSTLIDTWIPEASAEHFVSITPDIVTGRRLHRR
ncbi:MAG TPA: pyridoxamine 5'-phosphate oxidase family protein [Acidimicrobiia bacterium]|nr:pyridoxamine 5'-phosphate oxidase family protein [Acidimicrobiia bacterium]